MSFVTISVPPATYARLLKPLLAGKSRLHGPMTQRVLIADDSPDDIEMLKRFLDVPRDGRH